MEATTTPLDIDEYRLLIHLDEPFAAPTPAPKTEAERAILVDNLLAHLLSERDEMQTGSTPVLYNDKRRLLRALLTVRSPDPLSDWLQGQMDQLLQREAFERGLTDAAGLPRISQVWPETAYKAAPHCALWRGDITTLKVDAIVNAANAQMLGCFQPFHNCIDNVIHSAAGPRVREDCHAIMQCQSGPEGTGWAKATRAYNLPARYILHTVGPIVRRGRVRPEHERQLAACYQSCLELAGRIPSIRSVTFCCISTGVFGFPQEPAARIALQTVARWLDNHPDALDLVVFNVFQYDDLEIYQNLLRGNC